MIRRLFIDPGSSSSGWAMFDDKKFIASGTAKSKNNNMMIRLMEIATTIDLVCMDKNINDIYIECIPVCVNSKIAFNMKPLYYSVGVIGAILTSTGHTVHDDVIYPTAWQAYCDWRPTKKREGKRKILKGFKVQSEDELSAIGIGLYFLEKKLKDD